MITVTLDDKIFSSVIKGLYESNRGIDPSFIQSIVYDNIVKELKPHLEKWDYDKMSIEEWVMNYLTIAPLEYVDVDWDSNMIYVETELVGTTIVGYGYLPL